MGSGVSLRRVLLFLIVGAVLGVAGCGGGSDDSAASSDEPEATETAEETTDAETATSDADDEPDGSGGSDLSGVASAEDCRDLADLSAALGNALGGADIDVDRYATFLQEFADRTPEEIREDFQVLADAWAIYADVIGDLDIEEGEIPSAEQLAELGQAFQEVDQTALAEASTNIAAWVQENCVP